MRRMRLPILSVTFLVLPLALESALVGQERSEEPLDIGSRLELFVDDYLIESMEGVRLKLHEPQSAGKVLAFDRPCEGNTSTYVNILQDEDRLRMYYRGSSDRGSVQTSFLEPVWRENDARQELRKGE